MKDRVMEEKARSTPDLPLVAVVTPVYNGGEYLEATMRCVQRQTYRRLVHVIVDNCSTDATPEIIDRFRSQNVELITLRNDQVLTLRENWAKAISAVPAEASYMKVLCADDLMRPNCIERFVEVAESDGRIEVVLCEDIFGDKVHRANLPSNKTVFDGIEVAGSILDGSINWLPYHHLFIRHHNAIPSVDLFAGARLYIDFVAVLRSSLRGKLAYLHEPLVYTRWHENSVTSQYLGVRQLETMLESFDIVTTFGSQCWDPATFEAKRELVRSRLIRAAMKWILMGQRDAAQSLMNSLKERKAAPDIVDYLRSIVDWVPYKIWKRGWRVPVGPVVDERTFTYE